MLGQQILQANNRLVLDYTLSLLSCRLQTNCPKNSTKIHSVKMLDYEAISG